MKTQQEMKIIYGLKSVIKFENKTELTNCLRIFHENIGCLKQKMDELMCSCDLSPHLFIGALFSRS